jgi:curved DNA-binding protein CbpA
MTHDASAEKARDEDLERLRAWSEVLEDSSYYELLGVLELADAAAIQAAFHEFALAFHPDVHRSAEADVAAMADRVFRRGAEAYRVLSNPTLRAEYDLALARGQLRLVEGAARGRTPGALRSLEDLCRTPAARLSARKADQQIGEGNLREARRLLREAIAQDGDNPELEGRLEALDGALFVMGD